MALSIGHGARLATQLTRWCLAGTKRQTPSEVSHFAPEKGPTIMLQGRPVNFWWARDENHWVLLSCRVSPIFRCVSSD